MAFPFGPNSARGVLSRGVCGACGWRADTGQPAREGATRGVFLAAVAFLAETRILAGRDGRPRRWRSAERAPPRDTRMVVAACHCGQKGREGGGAPPANRVGSAGVSVRFCVACRGRSFWRGCAFERSFSRLRLRLWVFEFERYLFVLCEFGFGPNWKRGTVVNFHSVVHGEWLPMMMMMI